MQNKLIDLNNHLFAQLERLGQEGIKEDQLKQEIARTKSMCDIGKTIVENASLALEAHKFQYENLGVRGGEMPKMLENQ